jgi:hypothetical protein
MTGDRVEAEREIAPREVDVHARWKPERRRAEHRAVDQKQLE